MEKIFVVIPNWNGADMIADCLQSLGGQTIEHQVLVIDNGSYDDSVSIIKSGHPNVQLIELTKNTGFAGGVNAGIRYATEQKADAIALLNNDAIPDKDWLKQLVATLRDQPKAGIVTCKLMRSDKQHFDSTGDCYSVWGMPFPRGRNTLDEGQYDKMETIFSASGGASLYRTELFKEVGLFDEKFFAYYEDVDISFRAQLAGWQVIYQPKAIAYHQIGGTSSKLGSFTRYHATKNFYMLYLKNMPSRLVWKYLPQFTLQTIRLGISSVIRGGGLAFIKGTCRAALYTPAIFGDRLNIQSNRKATVQYIDGMLYKQRPPKIPTIS